METNIRPQDLINMYPIINLRIPAVIELWKDSYWSLRHRVEVPTLCPENVDCIWWIFWQDNVFVGRLDLLIFCPSFLWTFEGIPKLWETQPESVDLSEGISSQNMTTRLSADPDVIKFPFLDLDFIRTPNILNRPSGKSKLKKNHPLISLCSCSFYQAPPVTRQSS